MKSSASLPTADLCDMYPNTVSCCASPLRQFGGRRHFAGLAVTVRCVHDNVVLRQVVGQPGDGRVIVADGSGSLACALFGDEMASLAIARGWQGIIVNGAIRDSAQLAGLDIGVKALGTNPRASRKQGIGERDIDVTFGGVTFTPGSYVVSDEDGLIVLPRPPDVDDLLLTDSADSALG